MLLYVYWLMRIETAWGVRVARGPKNLCGSVKLCDVHAPEFWASYCTEAEFNSLWH